ncbi:MAG: MerR family transcriptional regulator [Chloroflexota bacterium]|nr:MerR family transcriptional regulator [Chloroflexota bacterium]MDE2940780.1 MerR family transcriptional regulator [Chloroflexota bacterium]MDE3266962.1 MerR family transcriptional regulator [Chloroflexota bacterium]
MTYTVKQVARLSGVTVRTLHHYDAVGLLRPAAISSAGYRLYSDADLERLQQVLFFRELGFSLRDIARVLSSPDFDRKEALAMHRRLLVEKRKRLGALIRSVDRSIATMDGGEEMTSNAMFDGFDESKLREYREEARRRWGGTPAWEESERRTSGYTKQDWQDIQTESDEINRGLAALMERDPAGPEAQELVGRWYKLINYRFYECSPEVFRGLADMYVEDARFTTHYDRWRLGLAAFLRQAMHVYADGLEKSSAR